MPKNDDAIVDNVSCEEFYNRSNLGTVEMPMSSREAAELLGTGMIEDIE